MQLDPPSQVEDGASAVEYGLLLAGVVAMIVLVIGALGGVTLDLFGDGCSSVHDHVTTSSSC